MIPWPETGFFFVLYTDERNVWRRVAFMNCRVCKGGGQSCALLTMNVMTHKGYFKVSCGVLVLIYIMHSQEKIVNFCLVLEKML